jgi:hypothetical protein
MITRFRVLLSRNPNGKCQTCGGMWGDHVGKCPRR